MADLQRKSGSSVAYLGASANARLRDLAESFVPQMAACFKAYGEEVQPQIMPSGWANYGDAHVERLLDCLRPILASLALEYSALCCDSKSELAKAVFRRIEVACCCGVPLSPGGPSGLSCTSPWRATEIFEKADFRASLERMIADEFERLQVGGQSDGPLDIVAVATERRQLVRVGSDTLRPEICLVSWGWIPDDDERVTGRARQTGFWLANDGAAAHDIAIDRFPIDSEVWASAEKVSRIGPGDKCFVLVWLEGRGLLDSGKWDLPGAMRRAADARDEAGRQGSDYAIRIGVTFRDSNNQWHRSEADLRYIASQNLLKFGVTEQRMWSPRGGTDTTMPVQADKNVIPHVRVSESGADHLARRAPSGGKRGRPKKPARRHIKYERIDKALREISEASPKNHEEVFRYLDDRNISRPNRKPFKSGWIKGYHTDPHAARAWLSQAWTRLELPAFPRGPKK